MKLAFSLLLTLFIGLSSLAQLYLNASVDKRHEGGTENDTKMIKTLFSNGIRSQFNNDLYSFGIIRQKEKTVFKANILINHNNYRLVSYNFSDIFTNHGTNYSSTESHKSAQIKYTYLGPKLGVNRQIYNSDNFDLLLGGTVQFEFLIFSKESEHYDSTISSWTHFYEYYGGSNQSGGYTSVSSSKFDAISLRKSHLSFGLNCSPRFKFSQFVLSVDFEMGINAKNRTYNNYQPPVIYDKVSLKNRPRFYSQIGFSFAYQIPKKSQ